MTDDRLFGSKSLYSLCLGDSKVNFLQNRRSSGLVNREGSVVGDLSEGRSGEEKIVDVSLVQTSPLP